MTTRAVCTLVLVAFLTQGLSGGLDFLQPYIFTNIFDVEQADHTKLARVIRALVIIVNGLSTVTFSLLSDRIGRRQITIFGLCIATAGFVALPIVASVDQFLLARLAVALGAGAITGMAAILVHDYAEERSRGKFVAVAVLAGIIGGTVITTSASSISRFFLYPEFSIATSIYVAFWSTALLLLLVASVAWSGLKDVTDGSKHTPPRYGHLFSQLLTANSNIRQWVSYGATSVAIFSTTIYGSYLALWAIYVGRSNGIDLGEALAAVGLVIGTKHLAEYVGLPIFALLADRTNRVFAVFVAAAWNASGLAILAMLDGPTSVGSYLAVILLGIGYISMAIAALTLAGQEAPAASRGAIMGGFALWGSIGSIAAFYLGGPAFDTDPRLPFALAAFANLLLAFFAVMVYRKSGEPFRLTFEQDESTPA